MFKKPHKIEGNMVPHDMLITYFDGKTLKSYGDFLKVEGKIMHKIRIVYSGVVKG